MPTPLPLLLFRQPSRVARDKRPPARPTVNTPPVERQRERLSPKFSALQGAFDRQSIQLQSALPQDDPELVVVLEVVGAITNFINAVKRIPGLEWLLEEDEVDIAPDEDFFNLEDEEKSISGSLFLLGSNRQALVEIISLWQQYQANPDIKLERGLAPWKSVFRHLRDIRFWSVQDRIGQDIVEYWAEALAGDDQLVRFEIEAWCYQSADKNQNTKDELIRLVGQLGGTIISSALIVEVAYHGFLVELPATSVEGLLGDLPPELALSEKVMFFRPRGQTIAVSPEEGREVDIKDPRTELASGDPVIGLLDGLPIQNHPLLVDRLIVDDPDNLEVNYLAGERCHGTAMASLIILGELDGDMTPLKRPIYVRPIMIPNSRSLRSPREEVTPDNILLLDLVHRAIRRIYEGSPGSDPVAPKIKVINLSIGEAHRPFDKTLSPWARLLDWLSYKYQVLFIVSAGNSFDTLILNTPKESLRMLPDPDRQAFAMAALCSDLMGRRLLVPAEAINVLTIGAAHSDASRNQNTPGRYDLFPTNGVAPYSAIGHGFRRSMKPDVIFPGGRSLYIENVVGPSSSTSVRLAERHSGVPGHRVAAPPSPSGSETYTRGTSNAAALASRAAANAYEVIEALRSGESSGLPEKFDAVLLKAMITHGASWGDLEGQILSARPDIRERIKQQNLISRFVGYGLVDVSRGLGCTDQRATLLGVGELLDGDALEFRAPLPPCLNAQAVSKRLTITLAWLTPVNVRNSKYRTARLWITPPNDGFGTPRRINSQWHHVRRGTLQHEIFDGANALAFVDGDELIFKVNCSEDGGSIQDPILFALCISLEVAEVISLPIYQEVRDRVAVKVGIQG